MEGQYSTRSPAVKRLMREAQELCEPTDQYFAQPLEDNLFEWHFTIRGPLDSDFQAGIYHGRIILPVDYPMKPPSIIWLTPNGRFETNKKICLSISGHHPESWQPSWSIRTALLAIIGFMPTHPNGAIGSLDYKPEEKKILAKKSRDWKCPVCGDVSEILLEPNPETSHTSQEAMELATQISFQGEKPKCADAKVIPEMTVTSSASSLTVPNAEGASDNASIHPPTNASINEPSPSMESVRNPEKFIPPWYCPPVVPHTSYAMPPPFLFYPWATPMPTNKQLHSLASQIPRFPYPPSFYANRASLYLQPGFSVPPGMAMPSHPPQPETTFCNTASHQRSNLQTSINHLSVSSPNADCSQSPHKQQPSPVVSTSSYTISSLLSLSPVTVYQVHDGQQSQSSNSEPINNSQTQIGNLAEVKLNSQVIAESAAANELSKIGESCVRKTENESVQMDELKLCSLLNTEASASHNRDNTETRDILTLIKDIGNDHISTADFHSNTRQTMNLDNISQALIKAFDAAQTEEDQLQCKPNRAVDISQGADSSHQLRDETDVSLPRKESGNESTGVEISHSELSVDGDDESILLANQMLDVDKKYNFERSTSSMPDLEMMAKHGTLKGLRHRQSATASVPTDSILGEQSLAGQNISGGSGQRIEAIAGDSSNQHQLLHTGIAAAMEAGQEVRAAQARSGYDTSFIIMVGLCLITVLILFNRIFNMVNLGDVFY